jgi:hypothetical protein
MADTHAAAPGAPGRTLYRIRVEGRLDELAFDYIDHLTLTLASTPAAPMVTTLTCELPDQEALVRLINLLHDFGLPLVSLERLTAWDARGRPAG